ncbi:MAG: hypothetical protein KZQ60_19885, partial [Candidatus Thiodiazotropha sp. (ex Lucinoma aequizonata)]|nr:hypothetical protein [Candidatus Thiodiazotropha sp. (ex Lucinoma aequizonata)]
MLSFSMVVPYGLYCGLAITVLTDRSHPLKICARDNLRYRSVYAAVNSPSGETARLNTWGGDPA